MARVALLIAISLQKIPARSQSSFVTEVHHILREYSGATTFRQVFFGTRCGSGPFRASRRVEVEPFENTTVNGRIISRKLAHQHVEEEIASAEAPPSFDYSL
jgi:hypothetical protein